MEYPGWNAWNEQENPASWYISPWSNLSYDPNLQYPPPEQQFYPAREQQYCYPIPERQYYYPPPEQLYYSPPAQQYWPPPEPEPAPQLWELLEEADEEDDEEEAAENRLTLRRALPIAINVLFFAVCLTLIAGAIAVTVSSRPDKSFFGYRIYSVVSESMEPTVQEDFTLPKGGFYKGDAIIVKLALPEKVKPGDILTMWTTDDPQEDDIPLTHRCMEVLAGYQGDSQIYFVTKGDHNRDYDPSPIPGRQLIGIKVLTLPKMGIVFGFAQDNKALTVALSITTLAVFFLLYVLLSRRKEDEAEEEDSPQDEDMPEPLPDAPPIWPAPAYAYEAYPVWAGYTGHTDAYGAAWMNQEWQPAYQEQQAYDPSWQWYQGM